MKFWKELLTEDGTLIVSMLAYLVFILWILTSAAG